MNSVKSDSLSLKYYRFMPSGCKDVGIRKFDIEAKTQFLFSRKLHKLQFIAIKQSIPIKHAFVYLTTT